MTDYNREDFDREIPETESNNVEEIYSSSAQQSADTAQGESSYEWNSESGGTAGSEYSYSYVDGTNSSAPHNPNNYEKAYSSYADSDLRNRSAAQPRTDYSNPYGTAYQNPGSSNDAQGGTYNGYSSAPRYSSTPQKAPEKKKKEKKPASRGFIAAMLAITMVASAALGFGGGYLAKNMNTSTSGNLTINQVSSGSITNASTSSAGTTSEIVKKTADSVVEIATEGIVTGTFARQYVTQGAGSGVIISEDGYIVTNHHVIENANTISVTLRDGSTSYDATLIGSDEDNDIALLKIDATGLSPATFGDSSTLAVGDYVVAIGNPLGTLGGTVTDGIISALAREVTIDDKNMTLLQTNAQISPGNSGGGLFNANGELVGIVNAKDSATEVEGIAFAIPVNNVLDIIKDLQNYGYVTGKIDLGMEFVDINSADTAFYYGVNKLGCYVISVKEGSNAETAGFRRGDLITKVNGTEVSTLSDINKVLENAKVDDIVTLTVYRNGQTAELNLRLAEYVPSAKLNDDGGDDVQQYQNGRDIWEQLFGW